MIGYYQLKCWATESFYEFIVEEGYTPAQSFDRCTVEYWKQLSGDGPEALTVYTTLLHRLVRCEGTDFRLYADEIAAMNRLWASDARRAFSGDALEELADEVEWVNRHSG